MSKVQWHSSGWNLQEIPQPSVTEISWKIIYQTFCSNLPGANELNFQHEEWEKHPVQTTTVETPYSTIPYTTIFYITSQLVSRIIRPPPDNYEHALVACMVSGQIVKQSIGTVYRYARWEGKHGGTEIHMRKTTPFAAMIWQEYIWFIISMHRVKWSTVRLTKWPSTIAIRFVITLHSLPVGWLQGQGAHITTVSWFRVILKRFWHEVTSVAYRYRKSISIIELFVSIISIYIGFLATNF